MSKQLPKYIKEHIQKVERYRELINKSRSIIDEWIYDNVNNDQDEILKELTELEQGIHHDVNYVIYLIKQKLEGGE